MTEYDFSDYQSSDYNEPYHDPDVLRRLYWDEGLTTNDIKDIFNVCRSTIVRAMQRAGVETRDMSDYDPDEYTEAAHRARRTLPQLSTTLNGYERIRHRKQEFKLHRLAAVAWFGTDAIEGDHIHHENGIPWDNREDNLHPMPPEKHNRHHANERRDPETGRFV